MDAGDEPLTSIGRCFCIEEGPVMLTGPSSIFNVPE